LVMKFPVITRNEEKKFTVNTAITVNTSLHG
jgi:hypothetical protein